ncbi:bifunctional biotin--[acetyl-CoA-carboxylase] ligase/biotin operon repressor BirA [Vibrio algicola]|uniref:Bifunctional ligase/repressor BirA n=1 Tax=Vibrio algicola TaxID=2662262 RepID=A0A5Q0TAW7_9VIBR|nr:bifunctional biotin--[acetyl-CoA-carboxylase] ligase/biotin operon repressor BirA [Vibrio algicola]
MTEMIRKEHVVKYQIIKVLSDGQFHSGEALGEMLGMSRAAISKHVKAIQTWGLDIYRVQGKGYQLSNAIELLDQSLIQRSSQQPVELIPIIDSTNQYLLDKSKDKESGCVCVAEYQAKGRGRRGREWVSPFGANLYFSMYWKLDAGVAAAMGLSLAIGVAIVDGLESLGAKDIKLKWPNDIYHHDKKLAGVLVEMSGQTGEAAHLVIGMGLNIHMSKTTDNIDQSWTNLEQVFDGNTPSRNNVVIALLAAWKRVLTEYEHKGMSELVERWNQLDNFHNQSIKLIMGNKEVYGQCKGINSQGAILLHTEQGEEAYVGGEISLRKADN